jgi:hypothetical protein
MQFQAAAAGMRPGDATTLAAIAEAKGVSAAFLETQGLVPLALSDGTLLVGTWREYVDSALSNSIY